ncbi:MAG: 3-methyl-2-oxobutanoate dehydrogenase subunit VorB [Chloroflexota bacterium]|nr:MAG: 3-methyl-2-oxobutanoate dehydrogenase subunit VorB [Chloroflexota bacterium]
MGKKHFMMGNEALAEAAVRAGCRFYGGYPITPSTEIIEYLSKRMPEVGGICLQSESELAAINMVAGASSVGTRAMTASTGLGISLMCEGLSNLAALELPAVIVNNSRGGPGSGHLGPSQGDYFQATKGGGHGEYRQIVLAPSTVQEMADLTMLAFHLADLHRTPVTILGDSLIAHLMETVEFRDPPTGPLPAKDWLITGAKGRPAIKLIMADVPEQHRIGAEETFEKMVLNLQEKFARIAAQEVRVETQGLEDADLIMVAFGSVARLVKQAMAEARKDGIRVGLIRPITLWPYPTETVAQAAEKGVPMLVVELSSGQMVEDVRATVQGRVPVHFFGRTGGMLPTPGEILDQIRRAANTRATA